VVMWEARASLTVDSHIPLVGVLIAHHATGVEEVDSSFSVKVYHPQGSSPGM
jgi:hypothetical protein